MDRVGQNRSLFRDEFVLDRGLDFLADCIFE